MDIKQVKNTMRKSISEQIALMTEEYLRASDDGLFRLVTSLDEFVAARNIMVYCSVEREPDTRRIAKVALSQGKTVAFPYCYRGGIMSARIGKSLEELQPAILGIPAPPDTAPIIAPEDLDLVIVPALMYDRAGYRIGYGGGYYDRYLRDIPTYTVGVAREWLLTDEVPREPHDVAVKCVITESSVLRIASA